MSFSGFTKGLFFCAGIIILTSSLSHAADAVIDLTTEKQLIRGFGGMNHTSFPGDITSAQADKAFGNGVGQIGMSILRIQVNPNSSQFSKELNTAKKAKSYGALIFASPWSPPSSMKTNNNQVSGSLKTESYAAYAAHLKSLCDYMSTNGVPLYAISVQNEPDIKVTYESCDWTSAQMIDFLKNHRDAIGTTKIIAPESFQFRRPFSDAILNDAVAVNKVDIIGGHIYGAGLSDYPLARTKGKEVWMTEHYTTSDRSANLWPDALEVGKEIHNCMVANFSAYVWWYIRRSYGPIDESGNVTKRGNMMAQYSKFVRPGFIRIDAPAAPATNVNVTAYKKADSLVIVVVNSNTSAKEQKFTFKGGTASNFVKYTSSQSKDVASEGAAAMDNGALTVTFDAQSVTTLVGKTTTVGVSTPRKDLVVSNPSLITTGKIPSDYAVYDLKGTVVKKHASGSRAQVKSGIYLVKSGKSEGTTHINLIQSK